jgi:pSer/pThr/pTyr-binding forkhead associated (FHA) protein
MKDEPNPTDQNEASSHEVNAQVSGSGQADQAEGFGLVFSLETGESKTFTSLPITIGRGDHNDLIIKDDSVSHEHARVYYDARIGEVCIEDIDSLNGVFIDNQPTCKNVLKDGSRISLGRVSVNFRDTGYLHPEPS